MKLQHKTLIFVMPLIIIPIVMIGSVAFFKLKNVTEDRLNTQVVTLLDQISQYISNKVSVAEANLLLLADNQLVIQYSITTNESVKYDLLLPNLLGVFKAMQKSIPDYYEIKFVLPDGFEDVYWVAEGVVNLNENIKDDGYFEDLAQSNNEIFKRVVYDKNTRQYALLIAHKILLIDPAVDPYGSPKKLRGYLILMVGLDHLRNEVNKNTIGESGFLSIVNNQGRFIFSPNEKIPELTKEFSNQLSGDGFLSQIDKVNKQSGILNNESVLMHSRYLTADLYLLSVLPEREILDSSQELGKLIILITVIAIVVSIFLVFFALQLLVLRPISDLNAAARSIGGGHLDLDIKINSKDEIGSLATSFMEMSKSLRQTHEEVSYTANHDGLTGLPNRLMFQEYLSRILLAAKQSGQKIALLFLDLDDFKQINDTLGHQAGDVLLQEVATRLSATLRKKEIPKSKQYNKASDLVARLGGDEFIILLNEVEGPFDVIAVADRILKKMKDPVSVFNNQIYANCSIGITLYPDDGNDASDLIKNADIAMYHAKEQGKNHYQFYSLKLNNDMQARLQMTSRLRIAIEQNIFFLHYQPKIDAITGKITGLEALIRWNDPELGFVSPAVFIAVAEESGLITPITEWVFNEVCRQCMKWKNAGVEIVPVAVNVSSIQFKRRDLVTMVNTSLQRSGLNPEYIEVELTETSLLTDTVEAIQVLNGLNDLGIKVALDDFGTGYSSLSYLNKLPIHTLKIDRSFVNDILQVDRDYAIIDAIIALAHALDLQVVAEGVETSVQLEYLKKRNCDVFQGYLLSKPLPANEIPQLINHKYFQTTH
jgi:diguanylate cyclase (GGDEF)-like protein